MNQKIIVAVVAFLLIVGGGFYFVSQKNQTKTSMEPESSESMDKDSESMIDEVKEKAFTGSLKAAVDMGVPMKCTYKVEGIEYEGQIKGEQYKGKVSMPDGKVGQVIMKENCIYTWADGESEGMKLCFTDEDESMWEQTDTTGNIPGDYNCLPAVFTDAEFDLPSDVTFLDLESMMQGEGIDITEE